MWASDYEGKSIVDGLYYGFDQLLNCDYLMEEYYENWTKLIVLQDEGVIFKWVSAENELEHPVCGQVQKLRFPNTIFISSLGLYSKSCDIEYTIAHELVHLIGFSHNKYEDSKVFYTIIDKCEIIYVKNK
jgi:hypothetical protein